MRHRSAALGLVAALGCFEYSPHAIVLDDSERDLHGKALARLAASPPPATTRFVVMGDTQLRFDDAADAIADLNARSDVAFAVQVGDFTHLGLLEEFRLMNEEFARLRVPYFVAIGIHEHLGNGEEIYDSMFGARDLAFTFQGVRFVLFDSNSREFGYDGTVPDVPWLERQLPGDGSYVAAALFSHVPPGTSDFDRKLVKRYDALLAGQPSVVSFHGHEEDARFEEREGTPLYVVDGIDGRSYLVVTVLPDARFEVERVRF